MVRDRMSVSINH